MTIYAPVLKDPDGPAKIRAAVKSWRKTMPHLSLYTDKRTRHTVAVKITGFPDQKASWEAFRSLIESLGLNRDEVGFSFMEEFNLDAGGTVVAFRFWYQLPQA